MHDWHQLDPHTSPYLSILSLAECFDATSKVLSHHADAYSFGVLLWAMLTGLEPWQVGGVGGGRV